MRSLVSDGGYSATEGVCAFLASLGILRTSAIHLVGKGALPSLLWLCRHGYEQVAILTGAPAPAEPTDLLLCLGASSPATFDRLATDMPRVRPGGVVIVRTDRRAGAERDRARGLLCRNGFRIERRMRSGRRDVYVARRGAPPAATSAAAGR